MQRPRTSAVGASALVLSALSALAVATAATPAPRAQGDDLERRLERCVEQHVEEADPSALAVVVDVGGEALLERGWGERGGRPAGVHTAFPAGSLTTQLVAAGVMRLVERGALELDTPLGEALEEFAEDPRGITVAHLLGHASGLPRLEECPAVRRGESADEATLLAWLREAPSYAEPGQCFLYSDADTWLAGLILERRGGASVRELVERDVIAGLDLDDTHYSDSGDTGLPFAGGQHVAGHFEDDGDAPAAFQARRLHSSAADLVLLQRALVAGDLVEESSWNRMTTTGRDRDGQPSNHGLGFGLVPLGDHPGVRFGGRAMGCALLVAWYPSLELTVALVAEGDDLPLDQLERRLVRTLLELPDPELVDLELTPEERAVYLGDYYMGCTRLTIAEGDDGRLRALDAEGDERTLLAQGGHRFVVRGDAEVRYTFEVDGALATAFELEEYGTRFRAVRID